VIGIFVVGATGTVVPSTTTVVLVPGTNVVVETPGFSVVVTAIVVVSPAFGVVVPGGTAGPDAVVVSIDP